MCRKLVLLALVLGMVSVSFADVIIGNWETADTNEGYASLNGAIFEPHGTEGVTLGSYDANIIPPSSAYTWDVFVASYAPGSLLTVADWMANNRLKFDIIRLTSEWTFTSGTPISRMHIAMSTPLVNWTTITSSAGVVSWAGADSNVMTATVDYSDYKASQGGTPSYVQIIFGTQASGWVTTGKYYIDNVRLAYVAPPYIVNNPDPCNGEVSVDANIILSWQAPEGNTPTGYNIYLDSNESAVQNATPASSGLFHKDLNQPETNSVPPSDLNDNTIYCWRVDILEGNNAYKGAVWKFKTRVYMAGDIDKDGEVTLLDIGLIAEQWLKEGAGWSADINKSLRVDFFDYAKTAAQWRHIIVEDLFPDSGSMINWKIVDEGGTDGPSTWQIVSGEMVEPSNIYGPDSLNVDNRRGTYAYWKDPQSLFWADYKFDVSIRSTDNDGIGVIFRYQNPSNYYKFDMDSQRSFRKLFKMYNGAETTLATSTTGYTVGQQMQLSVDVTGNQINILLNGVNVFGSAITDYNIECGTAALYNWGNAATYFDNFKVDVTRVKAVIANNDSYDVFENNTLNVSSNGVLSNDISTLGGSLTANLVSSPQHGQLTEFNADGTFVYTPDTNYYGEDSFMYEAVAAGLGSATATVTITVHDETEFSIIVIPDTQYETESYPAVFNVQTQWIVDNKDNMRIAFVLQEGDLTNDNGTTQWSRASTSMGILDGNVPYAASVGNHDIGQSGGATTRDTLFSNYFPPSRFSALGGVYESGHSENSYHYFTAGGIDWLVFALEFGPRVKILDWVNSVIAANPHRRAIIVTHNYMYSDDTLVGVGDSWNPHDYGMCSGVTGLEVCNDGEEMWTNCVKLHSNMSFVFSGHICNDGIGTLVSTGDNGNNVYQMLANYQNDPSGGNGWLRIITFYPTQQKVSVKTYSPYLDQYRTGTDNQFEFLNVDLTTP
jgi:hypothetical protein